MELKDRITECLKEKNAKKTHLAEAVKSPRATISDWTSGKTKTLSGEKLILASKFFRVNPEWLSSGKGPKYPQTKTTKKELQDNNYRHSIAENNVEYEHPEDKSEDAQKLIDIINECDRALNDSGLTFTKEERVEYYFKALDFAGKDKFSNELVNRYLRELMSNNANKKSYDVRNE